MISTVFHDHVTYSTGVLTTELNRKTRYMYVIKESCACGFAFCECVHTLLSFVLLSVAILSFGHIKAVEVRFIVPLSFCIFIFILHPSPRFDFE